MLFALESLSNLVKNGCVNKTIATIAGVLGIRMIGKASEEGTLASVGKARGEVRTVASLLAEMKTMGYRGGKVVVGHCQNKPMAERIREAVRAEFRGAEVAISETGGLCSFYAEKGGVLLGFEG